MTDTHDLGDVDAFTTGTVGRPGSRVFFVQARASGTIVSIRCEKQQADALAQFLGTLLNDLPDATDAPLPGTLELAEPVLPAFLLGSIGVAYDGESDRIVLQLEEAVLVDDEGNPDPESDENKSVVRLRMSRGQAQAFCMHTAEVVSAGRPACRFCGLPIDPDGHPCPRMN